MAVHQARGKAVSLVTINEDARLAKSLPPHVTHYPLRARSWRSAPRILRDFYRIIRRERPHIVHAHLFQANVLSRIAKLVDSRIQVVNTTHCNYGLEHRRYNPYLIYRWTKRWADVHTAVSAPALEALHEWESIGSEKSCLLFNAIEVDRYARAHPGSGRLNGTDGTPFKWIAVGRLNPVKNYRLLLQAVDQLNRAGHRMTLDIAGEGGELESLRRQVKQCGLEDAVRFLGVVHDLPTRLAPYDGYVISSDNEALPMALLEAMAAGLPAVGTRVGEIGSVLANSEGGYTVAPGDSSGLAAAMESMMRLDSTTLQDMGKRNRAYVEATFGMNRIVQEWERIYRGEGLELHGDVL